MSLFRKIATLAVVCAGSVSGGALADTPSMPPLPPISTVIYPGSQAYPLAPRLALVIGVATLKDGTGFLGLKNPMNDAAAVSAALHAAHFTVTNLDDVYRPEELTRQNIKKAIYDFAITLQSTGGVGVIYFSGHGVERNGQEYVAPYDAYVRFERDLGEELIPVRLFYDAFAYAKNPLNILIIDACRDNPWAKGLAPFGGEASATNPPASRDVVLATSTLSGEKSLDGSDSLSPYAAGFVEAMHQPDLGLGDFFSTVGDSVLELQKKYANVDMPALLLPAGHDFVFVPTIVTFNREQQIYQTGVSLGNRALLQRLTTKFAGGYFYKAAKYWLDNAPLAPVIPQPTKTAELRFQSALQNLPSRTSKVLEVKPAGTRLAVSDKAFFSKKWVAVDASWRADPAYLPSDSVIVKPLNLKKATITLDYEGTSKEGLENLTSDSMQKITALKNEYSPTLSRIEVVGYHYGGPKHDPKNNLRLLERQATAVRALSEIGYDAQMIGLSDRNTETIIKQDSVEIIVTGTKEHLQ